MNAHALPKGDGQSLTRQGTLDGNVIVQPRVPPFTTAGLLDYIVELVVCEDEVSLFRFSTCIIISYEICIGISAGGQGPIPSPYQILPPFTV